MTTAVAAWRSETVRLPSQAVLTVTCAGGTGRLVRLGDNPGDAEHSSQNLSAGDTVNIGPFTTTTQHLIEAHSGATLTYTSRQVLMQITTQAQYDALATKDAATLYLVPDEA